MYNFCAKCGEKYGENDVRLDTYACQLCKFVFYVNPKLVVNALIINPADGKLLLAQRKNQPYEGCWGIPGGFMMCGESPEDALARELHEELSVSIVRQLMTIPLLSQLMTPSM